MCAFHLRAFIAIMTIHVIDVKLLYNYVETFTTISFRLELEFVIFSPIIINL